MYVNFNILNQLGSPSLNSNTFANRPAAGQTGRLFISTDTFEIYRDNGTGWDLIGTGTGGGITGSGTANQVTYWTGTSAVGGESAFTYNPTTNALRVDGNISLNRNADNWSPNQVFTVGNGSFTSDTGGTYLTFNAYYNVDWKYSQNGVASFYSQTSTGHIWYQGASGTAGNNISLTIGMILDASGNVGLSSAPAAWNNTYKALQIGIGSSFYSNTAASDSGLVRNSYFDSIGWKYSVTGAASWYQQSDNNHYWFVAPSGTAGNPITFTQVMRVFTTANLVIGSNTDNGFRLQVNGDSQINGARIGRGNSNTSTNIIFGNGAGNAITSAANLVLIGNSAGNVLTTCTNSTFVGALAGSLQTSGQHNTYIGTYAGQRVTNSSFNTLLGYGSGSLLTTGGSNTFVGSECQSTTGSGNSFFGTNAGTNSTTGSNNVFLGADAGRRISGGGNLTVSSTTVLIGRDTRTNANSESNQIVIGDSAIGLGTNTTVIGNSTTSFGRWWGNLLLGTSTNDTTKALRVNGAVRIDGQTAVAAGGSAGLHLIVNCDGTDYKIALLNV